MTPELLPNIDLPYVIAMTTYPGATSEKVESEVTKPLEASFATLGGLKTISSQSRSNVSMITMEFADGTNLDSTTLDILQKINQVQGSWDSLVGTPLIVKMNPDMLPVMIAAVEQDGSSTAELTTLMEESLRSKLEGIEGVASVDISGERQQQVNVAIRADKVAEVNARMAVAIRNQIGDKKQDLINSKADLQSKLDDLKEKNTELDDGVKQLSGKMGDGWAQLGDAVLQMQTQLSGLEDTLADVQRQQDELTAQTIDGAIASAIEGAVQSAVAAAVADAVQQAKEDIAAATPGMSPEDVQLSQSDIDSITAQVTAGFTDAVKAGIADQVTAGFTDDVKAGIAAQVDAGFAPVKEQLQSGIDMLKAGIDAFTSQMPELQGQLISASVDAQYSMANAAAQLVSAQGLITSGISQIESGLDQFDDALTTALEQSNMGAVITMDMVSSLLKAQNFAMPAGYVTQDNTDYLVRVGDEVGSIDDLKDMALMDTGDDGIGVIRLSDVADVFMSDNLSDVYAKINGADGILLQFSKQSESSTTVVADNIMSVFGQLSAEYPGLKFTPLMNQGEYIYRVTNSITSDLLWGALFAVIILLLFLRDIRPTFITLCSIPISLVFALAAMYFAGVTINIISLGGLAIAVGRLVDDSVVVIENIFRLRAKGYSPIKAAVTGTSQVAGAIAASTLTTICVFLPIIFVQGLTRQLFTDFALTFAFALLASLAIAMTLVPTLASGMFGRMEPKEHQWLDLVIAVYDKALVWSLRYKPVVLIIAILLLGGSAYAVMTKGFSYMPESSTGQLSITLTMPKDSTVDQRKALADEASSRIEKVGGVQTVGMISGSTGGSSLLTLFGGNTSNMSSVTSYVLTDQNADQTGIKTDIENTLQDLDLDAQVSDAGGMDPTALGGSGININIYSDNANDLMTASKTISDAAAGVAGVASIDNGMEDATPEIHFTVDRVKAARYGLTTAQVYQKVSAALTKDSSATQVTWNMDNYAVKVVNENSIDAGLTPDYIKNLTFLVTERDGTIDSVRLADIAAVSEGQALPTVMRADQRRYLPVNVTIDEGHNITLVTQDVQAVVAGLKLPAGVTYEIKGESSTIMDAFSQLGLMLLLGILLVYLIMVAKFQSLKSPFIIMFTVPLALTGGFFALLVTGGVLSVISLIGFVMLVGVIVSNAIVLVDYIDRLRRDGVERVAAIREGSATRMRPILMTALATIFALLMMALGVGNGSHMLQPLAIVCIGGLAYGTLMTLFVIPIIYDSFNKKEMRKVNAEDLVVDLEA